MFILFFSFFLVFLNPNKFTNVRSIPIFFSFIRNDLHDIEINKKRSNFANRFIKKNLKSYKRNELRVNERNCKMSITFILKNKKVKKERKLWIASVSFKINDDLKIKSAYKLSRITLLPTLTLWQILNISFWWTAKWREIKFLIKM